LSNSLKCDDKPGLAYFHSFGILPFVFGGLTDSLNPCALTAAVFFMVLLLFFSSQPKFLTVAGGSFILAAFLGSFFSSMGIWDIVRSCNLFFVICRISYLSIAVIMLVLAVLSMRHWWADKKGNSKNTRRILFPWDFEMFDKKEDQAKMNILKRISHHAVLVFVVAFVFGGAVTLLGSVCPQQIYVSVIVYTLVNQAKIFEVLFSLLVYSFCFIVPLMLIFVFAMIISRSQSLRKIIKEQIGTVKMVYCAVLFAIGLGLIYTFL